MANIDVDYVFRGDFWCGFSFELGVFSRLLVSLFFFDFDLAKFCRRITFWKVILKV